MANSMKNTTSESDEVWYVVYGASNHMTSHAKWFSYLEKLEKPGVVETGDDISHPIEHVGEVPLVHIGQKGELMNVMHVLTITKIVDQGMQVRFTHLRCFIEYEAKRSRKGAKKGGYLSSRRTKSEPLCLQKGKRTSRISTYGTRVGHINFPWL